MTTSVIKRNKITIDASGQVVGRLASKIAMILMGKNKPNYRPHIDTGDKVEIHNVGEIRFTGKKMETKGLRHHSNHPGGLKTKMVKELIKEDPKRILIHAIGRMLPKNNTRPRRLLRISFK
ncbi:MAG: large subunit ribosomal protein L13 [Parcubacteria group bacterium Gr01-1014_13]|nr:MAG: large subunit ribosomal protein L13 [Parcubacteria group bacterium Gr01-1014_13]